MDSKDPRSPVSSNNLIILIASLAISVIAILFLGFMLYGFLAFMVRLSSIVSSILTSLFVIIGGALIWRYLYPVMLKAIVSVKIDGNGVYVLRHTGPIERLEGITRIVAISIPSGDGVRDILQIYHGGGRIDADFMFFESYPEIKKIFSEIEAATGKKIENYLDQNQIMRVKIESNFLSIQRLSGEWEQISKVSRIEASSDNIGTDRDLVVITYSGGIVQMPLRIFPGYPEIKEILENLGAMTGVMVENNLS